jgi:thiosulfate/3-mercaptopyruvate sulfurtransferase
VRWRQLVQPHWLAQVLTGQPVEGAPAPGFRVLEVGFNGWPAYQASHIPGAHYLDTLQFETPPFWNAVADTALQQVLLGAGITPATTVIVYGRNSLAAARVAHLMLYAGVQDVRLLDGGFAAWCAAGHPVQHGEAPQLVPQQPDCHWHGTFPAQPGLLMHTDQAKHWAEQPDAALVSIRSRAEYMGETSGYDYITARGEIPGALWGHAGRDGDVHHMGSFQTLYGHMRPAADIAAMWGEAGIHPHMHIGFYCGTGWRASLAFFYAWLMGWEHISVFDGGWLEWSSDPANPVVCRTPVDGAG